MIDSTSALAADILNAITAHLLDPANGFDRSDRSDAAYHARIIAAGRAIGYSDGEITAAIAFDTSAFDALASD